MGASVFPFWPRTLENRAAIRTAVAALAAVLIAFKFHLQSPYWSGMSVVIVTNLYTGSIIDKAMMRIIGTIAGAFLGFYLAGIIANSFLLYLLVCFLIIAVSVYYYQYSVYGYAYLLGALCSFIIIAQITIDPQNAFFVAIWRPVEIGIGVLVSAISVYVIFPNHLKDSIVEQVNGLFDDFSKELNLLIECLSQDTIDFNSVSLANLKIKRKLRKATELIGAMNHELGVTKNKVDQLRAFLDSFMAISREIHYITAFPIQETDIGIIQSLSIQSVFKAMQQDLSQLQVLFFQKSPNEVQLHTERAIEQLEQQFQQSQLNQTSKSNFIYSFILFLQQINQNLLLMHSLVLDETVKREKNYKVLNKQYRLRSDFELVKYSIKAGLAVLLALGFWLVSNWPGGINGIVSSLVLSVRRNLFEMKSAIIHRLIGCSLGGGLALSALAAVEMNLYDLIVLLFFAVWGFTYFMFKFPKYSYIGLQANIALIISLAQEGGPPVLLDPPLQRLAGVVIGIVASFLVANILWRTDVWTVLRRYLTRIYVYIAFNLNQVFLVEEGKRSLHDLASLFWISRGLIESLSDSSLNQKKQNLLTDLRQKFESLVLAQATISTILNSIDRGLAANTARLFHLDLLSYENKILALYEKKDKAGGEQLSQQLQQLSVDIEQSPTYASLEYPAVKNLLAYVNALNQLTLRVQA